MTEWLGLPALASAHGGQIDNLIGWIHVFMLILFVAWTAFFLYAIVRFRQSRNPVADYRGVTSNRSVYSEIGVAVVEAVLLVGFAIPRVLLPAPTEMTSPSGTSESCCSTLDDVSPASVSASSAACSLAPTTPSGTTE